MKDSPSPLRETGSRRRTGLRTWAPYDNARARLLPVKRALKSGNAHLALDAAAEGQRISLAEALSLCLLIREDKPVLYDKAAVRWFAKYAAEDRYLLLRDARELVDLLDGIGRHDQCRP